MTKISYFGDFKGFSQCGIHAHQLYQQPPKDANGFVAHNAYCSNRAQLLEAMSTGGRLGFDAPYTPRGGSSLPSEPLLLTPL
jgi:hypothetical protein